MQIGSTDLHTASAERESRRDAPPIADTARRNDRHLYAVNNLRNQRKRPHLRGDVVGQKHSAMAAGLKSLGDHGVDAMLFEPDRLGAAGRGAGNAAAAA